MGIPCLLNTIVTDIRADADGKKRMTVMNRTDGLFEIEAGAVILAMGQPARKEQGITADIFLRPGNRSAFFIHLRYCHPF